MRRGKVLIDEARCYWGSIVQLRDAAGGRIKGGRARLDLEELLRGCLGCEMMSSLANSGFRPAANCSPAPWHAVSAPDESEQSQPTDKSSA